MLQKILVTVVKIDPTKLVQRDFVDHFVIPPLQVDQLERKPVGR